MHSKGQFGRGRPGVEVDEIQPGERLKPGEEHELPETNWLTDDFPG